MTGCVALRNDVYYVRLSYYDRDHKRRDKFVSTGLSGRGAKQKATAMIESLIEKYKFLEKSDHPTKMADYLLMWKDLRKSEVAETTYYGYHTYIDRHLVPYFKELNLNIQDITAGNAAVDAFLKGSIELINNFMMALAEEQIKTTFNQSEKEVTDLHSRISQGIREAKKNGTQIGLTKGTTLTTKKSLECIAIIKKHSKDFGGSLEDPDVMKLCGCSRNSYYKYKKEVKSSER